MKSHWWVSTQREFDLTYKMTGIRNMRFAKTERNLPPPARTDDIGYKPFR